MTEERVKELAELETRRYFDMYLQDVFPDQMKLIIENHNGDRSAHGSSERKVNRLTWGLTVIIGLAGFIATLKAIFG